MGPTDAAIWEAALRLGLVEYDRLEYDVRLGGKAAGHVDASHELFPMWETLLRKRVDVVAWLGQSPTLIEVKDVSSFAALGQCLGYRELWKRERHQGASPSAVCVCAVADADLKPVFESYGVSVVALPEAEALRVLARRTSGIH